MPCLQKVFDEHGKRIASECAAAAAYNGHFEYAMDQIESGADPNYVRELWIGYASVSFRLNLNAGVEAIRQRNLRALTDFLDHGLDPNLEVQRSDNTPKMALLAHAESIGNAEAATMLQQRGARSVQARAAI